MSHMTVMYHVLDITMIWTVKCVIIKKMKNKLFTDVTTYKFNYEEISYL